MSLSRRGLKLLSGLFRGGRIAWCCLRCRFGRNGLHAVLRTEFFSPERRKILNRLAASRPPGVFGNYHFERGRHRSQPLHRRQRTSQQQSRTRQRHPPKRAHSRGQSQQRQQQPAGMSRQTPGTKMLQHQHLQPDEPDSRPSGRQESHRQHQAQQSLKSRRSRTTGKCQQTQQRRIQTNRRNTDRNSQHLRPVAVQYVLAVDQL